MPERAWRASAVLCLVVGLLLTGPATTASTAQPRLAAASLTISPATSYVGGQGLVFSGNIGDTGVREVHLQLNANYSGEVWGDVEGFSSTTTADGDFRFVFPAPAMFGIRYRVASGTLSTPYVTFDANSQDLTVTPVGIPLVGVPFDLVVDTTPTLARRPDTIGLQPIPGRTLTLQKRVTPTQWEALGTAETDRLGLAQFTVTEPAAGTHVYRVVQEDYLKDGNQIGWFPSFPTYVEVEEVALPGATYAPGASTAWTNRTVAAGEPTFSAALLSEGSGDRTTASQTFQWGVSLFDFAWVYGESLSAPPHRGLKPRGSWTEYGDGAGRVSSHNGGLYFDSKRVNKPGPGDFGTTMATMRGNARAYGRWEVRVRARSDETDAEDYLVRTELVPARRRDYDCGAHNITVGELTAHGSSILVGVNAGEKRWTHREPVPGGTNNVHFALATEVTKRHITWFVNGQPIATVKRRSAVSDLPMTLRMSLVGNGDQEMNDTDILSDWQRGFSLKRGSKVTSGDRMTVESYAARC